MRAFHSGRKAGVYYPAGIRVFWLTAKQAWLLNQHKDFCRQREQVGLYISHLNLELCYNAGMDRDAAIAKLREHEAELKQLGVEHLYLFGSTVRGVEIISEASRHLPDVLKAQHPDIPWPKVAGIGNVLRHAIAG